VPHLKGKLFHAELGEQGVPKREPGNEPFRFQGTTQKRKTQGDKNEFCKDLKTYGKKSYVFCRLRLSTRTILGVWWLSSSGA
jgi:hypothetical protein